MRRMWECCLKYLPEDRTSRNLVVTVVVSLLFHILIGVGLIVSGSIEQRKIMAKRGEALLVDIAPEKPKESAPRGDPSRLPVPSTPEPPRQAASPAPPAPKATPAAPAPTVPRVAEGPKATPAAPAPTVPRAAEAPKAAPESADSVPAPKAPPPAPAPDQSLSAKAEPQPPPTQPQLAAQSQPPGQTAEPRVASAPPPPPPSAAMFRRGGGGGLKGGRGGIEGDPVALDTPDPKYQDYFRQIRERIQSKWIYPNEAASRGIGGELQLDFGIAKSGELQFVERRRSSGVEILDDNALRAVQLASPFPPVPDAISKGGLPIAGTFRYIIQDSGLINKFLR